ncbi:MAG: diguanylate cyclase [Candidatus Acidiferrum sp.]
MERLSNEIRVLAVDDSPISRKLLEYALPDSPYKLAFAKDGREALDLIKRRMPDLVITDWELPDTSGPELCRNIRTEFASTYTYLLLLTSNTDKKSLSEGLSSGADDYLTKPFDREELCARVAVGRRVIELHREIEAKTKRLAVEARTDPLTGLPNRRAIEEWAVKQLAASARHNFPLWMMLVDLDSYRPVCDQFGHTAGDAMLRAFAEILRKYTRVSDMCGHFGGEQFILILSHVEKDNIHIVTERFRQKLVESKFSLDGVAIPMIASFGIAVSEGRASLDMPALLQKADAALLDAKRYRHAPVAR